MCKLITDGDYGVLAGKQDLVLGIVDNPIASLVKLSVSKAVHFDMTRLLI